MRNDNVTILRQAMSINEPQSSVYPSRTSTVDLVNDGQTI